MGPEVFLIQRPRHFVCGFSWKPTKDSADYNEAMDQYLAPMKVSRHYGKVYGKAYSHRPWFTEQIFNPDSIEDRMPIGNFQGCHFVISPFLSWRESDLIESPDVYLAYPTFYYPEVSVLDLIAHTEDFSK